MTPETFFTHIESQYSKKHPFVIYRKPNKQRIHGLLQSNQELYIINDFTEKGFVFSPFDDTEPTVLMPLNRSDRIQTDIIIEATQLGLENQEILRTPEELSAKQRHLDLVKKGVDATNNDQFKKVVLSRQESIKISETNPLVIFKKLINRYPSAFVYCWYHPKVGLWLGATPETLVKIEGHQFSMMALAGTQDYKGTLDVIWQEKEQQEQQYVTDFIIDNLKPSVENFKVSDVETVKAGNLLHLKTMISARLKKEALLHDIIRLLHPTPAICGLPKLPAKEFILKNEGYNREYYTGFLGELNFETTIAPRASDRNIENRAYSTSKTSTQLYVNLRCMQIKEARAIIYVGGGITESSVPENEWEETVSKSFVIKNIL